MVGGFPLQCLFNRNFRGKSKFTCLLSHLELEALIIFMRPNNLY